MNYSTIRSISRTPLFYLGCILVGVLLGIWNNPTREMITRLLPWHFSWCGTTTVLQDSRYRLVLNRYDANWNLVMSEDIGPGWLVIRDGACISYLPSDPEEARHPVTQFPGRICGNVDFERK